MILISLYLHRFNINFWLTQEFSVHHQNPSVLRREFAIVSSYSVCLQPSLPNLIYEVCKHGELCWCSRRDLHFFFCYPSKTLFCFISVSHSGTSLTRGLKEDDSARVDDAGSSKRQVLWILPAIADVHLKIEAY